MRGYSAVAAPQRRKANKYNARAPRHSYRAPQAWIVIMMTYRCVTRQTAADAGGAGASTISPIMVRRALTEPLSDSGTPMWVRA